MLTNEFLSAECSQPQPTSKMISGDGHDGVAAAADAVARFQHDDREAGIFQRARSAEAGSAGADDGDIDFGGEGHDVVYLFVMPGHSRPEDGVAFARLCPGHPRLFFSIQDVDGRDKPGHDDIFFQLRCEAYATACLAFSARLRSLASRNFLRSRIDFGVTSTSSSSSI